MDRGDVLGCTLIVVEFLARLECQILGTHKDELKGLLDFVSKASLTTLWKSCFENQKGHSLMNRMAQCFGLAGHQLANILVLASAKKSL
jgi:hypothetical protein